jgi:large subunit ribosomal protein L24
VGLHIKKGDTVKVIAGKDAGAEGRVLEVIPKKRRVIVEAVNRATRHEKIRMDRRGTRQGGIEHKEAPVDISNVALICPTDGPTRVGFKVEQGSDTKVRVCIKCGLEL